MGRKNDQNNMWDVDWGTSLKDICCFKNGFFPYHVSHITYPNFSELRLEAKEDDWDVGYGLRLCRKEN
jgi:hypothetical protein